MRPVECETSGNCVRLRKARDCVRPVSVRLCKARDCVRPVSVRLCETSQCETV